MNTFYLTFRDMEDPPCIQEVEELAPGVFRVQVESDRGPGYVQFTVECAAIAGGEFRPASTILNGIESAVTEPVEGARGDGSESLPSDYPV